MTGRLLDKNPYIFFRNEILGSELFVEKKAKEALMKGLEELAESLERNKNPYTNHDFCEIDGKFFKLLDLTKEIIDVPEFEELYEGLVEPLKERTLNSKTEKVGCITREKDKHNLRKIYGASLDTVRGCYEILESLYLPSIANNSALRTFKQIYKRLIRMIDESESGGVDLTEYRRKADEMYRNLENSRKNNYTLLEKFRIRRLAGTYDLEESHKKRTYNKKSIPDKALSIPIYPFREALK